MKPAPPKSMITLLAIVVGVWGFAHEHSMVAMDASLVDAHAQTVCQQSDELKPADAGSGTTDQADGSDQWQSLAFVNREIKLGDVAKGSRVKFSFAVTNPLKKNLKIGSINSSCGCTSVETYQLSLAPGETSEIIGSIDTIAYSGRRIAVLTVRVIEPVISEVRLRVQAFIRQDVVFHPSSIEFNDLFAGESHEATITLMHAGTPRLEIESIQGSSPWMKCTHRETYRNGDKSNHEIKVTLDRNAPAGTLQQQILLKIKSPERSMIPLLVTGELLEELAVFPRYISLGQTEQNIPKVVNLVIKSREPVKLRSIESSLLRVACEMPTSRKRIHLVRVEITPFSGETRLQERGKPVASLKVTAVGKRVYTAESKISVAGSGTGE